jgi:hypothetical protein
VDFYRRALRIRASNLPEGSPLLAKSQSSLAAALALIGENAEAEQLFRDALAIEQAYADQNPTGASNCRERDFSFPNNLFPPLNEYLCIALNCRISYFVFWLRARREKNG